MLLELKKKANKARQENITNELLDIIGGSEALSK
jgi:F-type H+-transporting ATPase subunit gamma